jgi:hypothetical protein
MKGNVTILATAGFLKSVTGYGQGTYTSRYFATP